MKSYNQAMKKYYKKFHILFIVSIFTYIFFFIYTSFAKLHSVDWNMPKEYLWIFKDSVIDDIDDIYVSLYTETDAYLDFNYKGDHVKSIPGYKIKVWEFKNEKDIDIHNSKIKNEEKAVNFHFEKGEILNEGSISEITLKEGYSFGSIINISAYLGTVDTFFNEDKYVGFYGKATKIFLSNQKDEIQIVLNNETSNQLVMALLYMKNNKLYVIVINSNKYFDKDIINILNLK